MSVLTIGDFSAGLNQHSDPIVLNENSSPFMADVSIAREGVVSHRRGSTLLGTVSGSGGVQGSASYDKNDGTHELMMVAGGNLYKWTGSAWSSVAAAVVSTSSTVDFVNYLNRLYFIGSGATEYLSYWDGSSVTVVSGNIPGKYLTAGNDRLVVGGTDANGRRNYFSAVGSDTITTASDYIDFDAPTTALNIFGESYPFIGADGNRLYVFDPSSQNSRPIDKSTGCTSQSSMKSIQGHVIYLSREGIMRHSPTESFPTKISTALEDEVLGEGVFDNITGTGFGSAAGEVFRNKYYLSVGDLGGTIQGEAMQDTMIVFDIKQSAFTIHRYPANGAGASLVKWIDSDGVGQLMAGSRDNRSVYYLEQAGVYTDENSSGEEIDVEAFYRTKSFDFSGKGVGVEAKKNVGAGFLRAYNPGGLAVSYNPDANTTTYIPWKSESIPTTSSSKRWSWSELMRPGTQTLTNIGFEFRGIGGWRVNTLGFNVTPSGGSQSQPR